jgi:hypothetical protein
MIVARTVVAIALSVVGVAAPSQAQVGRPHAEACTQDLECAPHFFVKKANAR